MARKTKLYQLWLNIRNRCNNPKTPDYRYYGGRGIKVCPTWNSFKAFAGDVGASPGPGWTLDRIDTNGDYLPGNVRWATRETQARNRNYCKLTKPLADQIRREYVVCVTRQVDLAKKYGVTQPVISSVVRGASWR